MRSDDRWSINSKGTISLPAIALPGLRSISHNRPAVSHQTSLPKLSLAFQAGGGILCWGDPRQCDDDRTRNSDHLRHLANADWFQLRDCFGGTLHRGPSVSGSFLSPQLELLARL